MKITVEYLQELKACGEACEWFSETFPSGATIERALAACDREDWVCWLACKVSATYRYWCVGEAIAIAHQATHDDRLKAYVGNVTPENWLGALAAADDAAYAYDADAAEAAYAADAAAAYAYAAAEAADAGAYAYAARKREYKKLRAEAERALLALDTAGGEARP